MAWLPLRMEVLGDYELTAALGEGATGRVFDATERGSGRRVAVKILHADLTRTAEVRDKVAADLGVVTQIRSPHAATVHAVRIIGDRVAVEAERLEGESLRARIERGRLPWHEAVTIGIQIGEALAAAHGLTPPLLHRDLKPECVLLTAAGAKVTDFGLANVLGAVGQTTTATFGNIRYMSPEQIDAWGIDERSDVYCLGLVLYEMIVGRQAVAGTSPRELLNAQCTQPPPPFPPDVVSMVPPDLERVVRHFLEKSKDARPASARAAIDLLRAVLHGQAVSIAASPTTSAPGPGRAASVPPVTVARAVSAAAPAAKSSAGAIIGIVVAVVAVLGGAGAFLLLRNDADAPKTAAAASAEDAPVTATPKASAPVAKTPTPTATPTPNPDPTPDPAPDPDPDPDPAPDPDPDPDPDPEPTASPLSFLSSGGGAGSDAPEEGTGGEEAVAEDDSAVAMLLGEHRCAIHWIHKKGTCTFERKSGKLEVSGTQGQSGDFFKIDGTVKVVSDRTFIVNGTLDSRVSGCCGRRTLSGSFKFQRHGSRKYWRLQDPMRSKICHPTKTCMYYVDIFMKK